MREVSVNISRETSSKLSKVIPIMAAVASGTGLAMIDDAEDALPVYTPLVVHRAPWMFGRKLRNGRA